MKRILSLFLTIIICCSSAYAYEWEDENGTVWIFNISGENATISGHGDLPTEVIIPSIVYNDDVAYKVTSI